MTSTAITTTVLNTTETLSGVGDDLLVANSGSIVDTNGDYGVVSSAGYQAITIDGLVYSVYDAAGVGVALATGPTNLFVNGQIQGDVGVLAVGGSQDNVNVGAQGSIDGVNGPGVSFEGSVTSPFATYDTLSNAGDISTGFGELVAPVTIQYGGGDFVSNSGTISGTFGITYFANVATEAVENSGTIEAGKWSLSSAIDSYHSSAGVDVANSGLITGGSANTIGSTYALLFFSDNAGTTSAIDNQGTISGSGYVIQSVSDLLDIANSGTIHGGLYSTAAVDVHNSGLWHGAASSATTVFSLSGADNVIANAQSGVISGGIAIQGGADTIDNAGKIDGAVTLLAGGDTLTNAGSIDGAVTFTGAGATNTFTNSGDVTGAITLSGAGSTFTNSGDITGDVAQKAGKAVMTNHGQIYGDVTLVGSDTLTNTGTIHGDVKLGASDTIDDSRGAITGAITAANSDTFRYHGLFGTETIDSFIAGSGSTHDTVQFAANDFGSFAAVQSAMSQVGSDTLIRLDANDSITLVGVTMSSLVAGDFKFT